MLSLLSVVTIELLERVEAGLVVVGVGVVVEAAAVVEAVGGEELVKRLHLPGRRLLLQLLLWHYVHLLPNHLEYVKAKIPLLHNSTLDNYLVYICVVPEE